MRAADRLCHAGQEDVLDDRAGLQRLPHLQPVLEEIGVSDARRRGERLAESGVPTGQLQAGTRHRQAVQFVALIRSGACGAVVPVVQAVPPAGVFQQIDPALGLERRRQIA
ncbi:MAG: hypothetical protein DBY38_11355 [Clostridium cadaveris]|uniref:Uncharacterized protein n=1 Tax=Clostridium cadaveris TaxID=1529 RepID=A0A316M1N2_9CLOT|nr:MAG: hypothetical protein DBY38_11355 [Clostridium cadaveris]